MSGIEEIQFLQEPSLIESQPFHVVGALSNSDVDIAMCQSSSDGNRILESKERFFVLPLIISGAATIVMNGREVLAGKHSVFLFNSENVPTLRGLTPDFEGIMIFFKKEFLLETTLFEPAIENLVTMSYEKPFFRMLDDQGFHAIRSSFMELQQEYLSDRLFKNKMVQVLFVRLLLQIVRYSESSALQIVHKMSKKERLVAEFKRLVNIHFLNAKRVTQYASMLFVSSKYLSETVKEVTGFTALNMIHQRVYLEAKRWLSEGSYSVKEISFKLNFESSAQFSRFFKKIAGQNPTQFLPTS